MTEKIKCIVVDDEPLARELIETHIAQTGVLENLESCNNAIKAFEVLNTRKVELMFLDIQMPLLTGLDFLRGLKNPPKVIITTAFRNYALEGFELDVVDYLLKPITFQRFFKAIEKYNNLKRNVTGSAEKVSPDPDFIYLRANKKSHKVFTSDILYIESLRDYINVHTIKDTFVIKEPLSEIEARLAKKRFLRIHRSFLVNVDKITAFTATDIEIGIKELPVGSSYRESVQRLLNDHRLTD